MNGNSQAAILVSGGLDSTTLCYDLLQRGERLLPIFFDYGQHCIATELSSLQRVLPDELRSVLEVVDISAIYKGSRSLLISEPDLWHDDIDYKDMYLPYRSLLLLTAGAAIAQSRGIGSVYAAFINSNHAQEIDCSIEFFAKLGPLFSEYGGVEICLPYRDLTKVQVATIGIELGAPIGQTFSCQASADIPCGACPNCVDRLEAIQAISGELPGGLT